MQIVTPADELPPGIMPRRVEDRTWPTQHSGLIALHAGHYISQLQQFPEGLYGVLTFDAIVGVADVLGCIPIGNRRKGLDRFPPGALDRWPWLADHQHAEGPYGWILGNVRRLETPIPAEGSHGLWDWEPPAPLAELPLIALPELRA